MVSIPDGKLVNRQSGEPIPDDEPVFILRGRDALAVDTLISYLGHGMNREHRRAVEIRLAQFQAFSKSNPSRMKEPDTTLTDGWKNL